MRPESYADLQDRESFDWIVVGSGFGGSVAALRLAEKGYRVAVLEAGRHFEDADFAKTNWDLRRYLWAPLLGCFGIQRLEWLGDLMALAGAGLGGGSLVYANTLLEPGDGFYASCKSVDPRLKETLAPHYATARRMLGVAPVPKLFAADEVLEKAAGDLGRGGTFKRAEVGVNFASPDEEKDPYFGGEGPARRGCRFCGGCMVGCRHNAKNTLVKNYLHFAAKKGARLFTYATVTRLERGEGGLGVTVRRSGWGAGTKTLKAARLALAAGTIGTLKLLLAHAARLGCVSSAVGRGVRTNGEQLLGARARTAAEDWSAGLAITSGAWPDEDTHVEVVRYPEGSDAMGLLATAAPGTGLLDRLRALWPLGFAKRSTILLAMQPKESRQRLRLTSFGLRGEPEEGYAPPPRRLPSAEALRARFAARMDGVEMTSVFDHWLGVPTTAHILGGACRAASPADGAARPDGRLWGADDCWVLDGSSVPGNLGVNPSLTITALAEHAMSLIPEK